MSNEVSIGLEWTPENGAKPIREIKPTFEFHPLTVEAEASAEAKVSYYPQWEIGLYRFKAVWLEPRPYLKEKVEAGCDFLTTQMFFDNNLLYNFLYKIREAGITVPVVAGIMPITNANQVARAIQLSGSFMPQRFKSLVDKFGTDPAAMKQAGIAYATDQIIDLYANGITNIHVYSMNKPEVAAKIQNNLSDIIGKTL